METVIDLTGGFTTTPTTPTATEARSLQENEQEAAAGAEFDEDMRASQQQDQYEDDFTLPACTSCGVDVQIRELGLSCSNCDIVLHIRCLRRGIECDC